MEEVAPAAAADLDRLVQESLERWMTFKAHAKDHAAEKRIPAGRARYGVRYFYANQRKRPA